MKILKANKQGARVLNSSIQQAYKFSVDGILCNISERAVLMKMKFASVVKKRKMKGKKDVVKESSDIMLLVGREVALSDRPS